MGAALLKAALSKGVAKGVLEQSGQRFALAGVTVAPREVAQVHTCLVLSSWAKPPALANAWCLLETFNPIPVPTQVESAVLKEGAGEPCGVGDTVSMAYVGSLQVAHAGPPHTAHTAYTPHTLQHTADTLRAHRIHTASTLHAHRIHIGCTLQVDCPEPR